MSVIIPWIRTIVSFPLGLLAIQLSHLAAGPLFPQAYGELASDPERSLLLALATFAGIFGSAVVAAVARHHVWLHMLAFLLVMLAIDIAAIRSDLATQPFWFKGLIIATLPLQVFIGGRLAMLTFRKSGSSAAI